jgi:hypothetical protein
MLLPLGILGQGGAAGGGAAFELISTTIATGSSTSVTFSSIPATYTHLQLRVTNRGDYATTNDLLNLLTFNGDTAANYSWHHLYGDGTSAGGMNTASASAIRAGVFPGGSSTATVWSGGVLDILDYANANKYKTARMLVGSHTTTGKNIKFVSGNWRNTAAITSLTLTTEIGNFTSGSRFSLYGIKGA